MKKMNSLSPQLTFIACLFFAMVFVSFTRPQAVPAKQALTFSYEEDFTYVGYPAGCGLMAHPGYFPDDPFYVDTDPSYIAVGTHIYYDAAMTLPVQSGYYFFYHNEYAEFYRCTVGTNGEVIALLHCQ